MTNLTIRDLLIAIGLSALTLAALALALAIRAVVRHARAGRPRVWAGLVFRGVLIAGLLAVAVASLANVPPPPLEMVNHPNPTAATDATIAFLQTSRDATSQTVVGVSARDGATRWTRTLDGQIASLLSPAPSMVLAPTTAGLYALRMADGAVLWHYRAPIPLNLVAVDGARVVALTYPASGTWTIDVIALSLATGAVDWRAALPASVRQAERLAVGDGRVFVEGWAPGIGTAHTTRTVVALRAADGAPQWTKTEPLDGPGGFEVQALFIMQGYAVVVPVVGPVMALRERDGAIAWAGTPNLEEPDNPPQIISATADSDTIYMVWHPYHWATGANGRPTPPPVSMSAMAVGGTIRWHMNVQPAHTVLSSLAISDGVLLGGNAAYDAASGRPLWGDNTPRVGVSWNMSPLISPWSGDGAAYRLGIQPDPYIQDRFNCVIFCRPGISWLYAVNVRTGAPWWRIRMGYTTWLRL